MRCLPAEGSVNYSGLAVETVQNERNDHRLASKYSRSQKRKTYVLQQMGLQALEQLLVSVLIIPAPFLCDWQVPRVKVFCAVLLIVSCVLRPLLRYCGRVEMLFLRHLTMVATLT